MNEETKHNAMDAYIRRAAGRHLPEDTPSADDAVDDRIRRAAGRPVEQEEKRDAERH